MADSQRIDDVLDSIRRLVSEEVAEQAAEAAKDVLPADALILDSAKRVTEPEDPFQAVAQLGEALQTPPVIETPSAPEAQDTTAAPDADMMPRWDVPPADDPATAYAEDTDFVDEVPSSPARPQFDTAEENTPGTTETAAAAEAASDGPETDGLPVFSEDPEDAAEEDLVLDFIESLPDAIEEAETDEPDIAKTEDFDKTDAAISAVLSRGGLADGPAQWAGTPADTSASSNEAASSSTTPDEPDDADMVTASDAAEAASTENTTDDVVSPFAFFAESKPPVLAEGEDFDALGLDDPSPSGSDPEPEITSPTIAAPSDDVATEHPHDPTPEAPALAPDSLSLDAMPSARENEVNDSEVNHPAEDAKDDTASPEPDFVMVEDEDSIERDADPEPVIAASHTAVPEVPTATPEVLDDATPDPEFAPVADDLTDEDDEEDILSGGIGPDASPVPALDTEALRELVAEVVRQELAGALGERITRNVRKLVRRELKMMFSGDEFD